MSNFVLSDEPGFISGTRRPVIDLGNTSTYSCVFCEMDSFHTTTTAMLPACWTLNPEYTHGMTGNCDEDNCQKAFTVSYPHLVQQTAFVRGFDGSFRLRQSGSLLALHPLDQGGLMTNEGCPI